MQLSNALARPARAHLIALVAISTSALFGCGGGGSDTPAPDPGVQAAAFTTYTRADSYGTNWQPDILVPMRDGFQLTCDLYRPAAPDGSPAPGKFPSILMNFTAYGRTNFAAGADLRNFARKGYTLLWCNTRGSQGVASASPSLPQSVAPTNPFSPTEFQDAYDVIEWIAAQAWSTGKVGQIGISYGGITTLQAAAQNPPHLTAIVSNQATNDLYRDWVYLGGIHINSVPNAPGSDPRAFWAPNCGLIVGEATCPSRLVPAWNSNTVFNDYWAARAFDPASIKIPHLIVDSFPDFWLLSADRMFAANGARDNVSRVIGPWQHVNIEKESPELLNMYLAWFDRWLGGMETAPMPPKALVQGIQSYGTTWTGFSTWPPQDTQSATYFLSPGATLQDAPPAGGSATYVVAADGSSTGLTFATPAFATPTTVAGEVAVKLRVSFTATDGNVIVQLSDLSPNGTQKSIGINKYLKVSHRTSDSSPSPVVPGQVYDLALTIPSKYWTFGTGHKLVLTVTSSDPVVDSDAPAGTVSVNFGPGSSVQLLRR